MSDLTESRISEIRERLAKADSGPWKVYLVEHPLNDAGRKAFPKGDVFGVLHERAIVQAWDHPQLNAPLPIVGMESSPYRDQTHTISISEANAEFIAHSRADLEALLAEREGMKAEIERLNARLAWRDHHDSCHPCGSHVRAMCEQGVEIYSRTQTRAPLDPSSAPGIGRIVARYASETRRLRAELESARSPEREAGSGTPTDTELIDWLDTLGQCAIREGADGGEVAICKEFIPLGIGGTVRDALRRAFPLKPLSPRSSHPVPSEGGGE